MPDSGALRPAHSQSFTQREARRQAARQEVEPFQRWVAAFPPEISSHSTHRLDIPAELAAISQEQNAEGQHRSLFHFGVRLGQSGNFQAAGLLLSRLQEQLAERSEGWAKSLAIKAEEALNAGGGGRHFEALLQGFVESATDPGMLGGFLAASSVARSVRLLSLTRLLLSSQGGLLTRGLGASFAASGLGLFAEVPTLLLASKGIHQALGRPTDWSWEALRREAMGLGLSLVALKGLGWASGVGVERIILARGVGARHAVPLRVVAAQGGMLAGIHFAHQVEAEWGLRPEVGGMAALLDSLAFLLQNHVGGRLGAAVAGKGFLGQVREAEVRLQGIDRPDAGAINRAPTGSLSGFAMQGVPNSLGPVADFTTRESGLSRPLQMSGSGEDGGPDLKFLKQRFVQRLKSELSKKWKLEPSDSTLGRILNHFSATPMPIDPQRLLRNYFELISKSPISPALVPGLGQQSSAQVLDRALQAFRYAFELNAFRTVKGSLYEHLLQFALERTLESEDAGAFHRLVEVAAVERSVAGLENFLASHPELEGMRSRIQAGQTETLSGPPAFDAPSFVVRSMEEQWDPGGGRSHIQALWSEQRNFLLVGAPEVDSQRIPLKEKTAWRGLTRYLARHGTQSREADHLVSAFHRASESVVPPLVFDRIFKILTADDLPEKLKEIARWEPFRWQEIRNDPRFSPVIEDYAPAAQRINGTVYTGYVEDMPLAEKLANFYAQLEVLLKPDNLNRSRRDSLHRAGQLLAVKEKQLNLVGREPEEANFDEHDVLEMLYLRPTRVAALAREAIYRQEKVDLLVLNRKEVQQIWSNIEHPERNQPAPHSFFVPTYRSRTGRPQLILTQLDATLTREEKIAQLPYLAARAVHEFEHYLHHSQLDFITRDHVLRSEMRSLVEEVHYLLQQGILKEWNSLESMSPYGMGMYVRNFVDEKYLSISSALLTSGD